MISCFAQTLSHGARSGHMIGVMSDPLVPLFAEAPIRQVDPVSPLFHRGDAVGAMMRVVRGQVFLSRQTPGGQTVVLQAAGPGDVLAEASAWSSLYHCDATAGPDGAAVAALPVTRFLSGLASDPDLAGQWMAQLARAVQRARMRAELRSLHGVAARLDLWLADNPMPPRGRWQDLAAELGVTREALYRELSRRRRAAAATIPATDRAPGHETLPRPPGLA